MTGLMGFFRSTVGLKIIVAITGLLLIGFVVAHLLGNLQMFAGPEYMNDYAAKLKSLGPLLWIARAGLIAIFVVHLSAAIMLSVRSKRARPKSYEYSATVQAPTSSLTMMLSGPVILGFVLLHLAHFTLHYTHPEYATLMDETGRHDVYRMVVYGFQNVTYSIIYIAALALLSMHLSHGIPSFIRTLGFNRPQLSPLVNKLGKGIAAFIFLGFVSIPVAVQLGMLKVSTGVA